MVAFWPDLKIASFHQLGWQTKDQRRPGKIPAHQSQHQPERYSRPAAAGPASLASSSGRHEASARRPAYRRQTQGCRGESFSLVQVDNYERREKTAAPLPVACSSFLVMSHVSQPLSPLSQNPTIVPASEQTTRLDIKRQPWFQPEWTEAQTDAFLATAPQGAFVIRNAPSMSLWLCRLNYVLYLHSLSFYQNSAHGPFLFLPQKNPVPLPWPFRPARVEPACCWLITASMYASEF